MPRDESDPMFVEWQALRKQAAAELHASVLEWANQHGPDNMSMASVRVLQQRMENFISAHSRQVFDRVRSGIRHLT